MQFLLIPLFCLAVGGLLLSLLVHVCALLGLPQPLGEATWVLHLGIFVVFIPALFLGNSLRAGRKKKQGSWEWALRGCPRWMRWLTYGLFIYAVINFLTFIPFAPRKPRNPEAPTPPVVVRGFSGHWMLFYGATAATFYSAWVVRKHYPARWRRF
jgi:hypothetical protein